ncbi:monocarboxylate transporter 13-like [Amphiura filiformis]|uniref:monocarboxylate transporter 13-like n=1 Tax=Amphiura filiformis TaxID=82378 RepID=UPI003B21AE48
MATRKRTSWEKYWGWVVVFSRFSALFMLLGTYKSFGVLMDSYIYDLDTSAAEAGTATVLFFAFVYFTAPIFGVLADMMGSNGARILIMLGGIISTIAMCLSALSTTWYQLAFYLSLAGVGYGMVQVPTVAPLLMYFTDKFGLANSISAAGGAVGMIVLPPLTERMIDNYGWRGASIILGVASLHTTVAGALMRPPSSFKEKRSYQQIYGKDDAPQDGTPYESLTKVKRFAKLMQEQLSIDVFRKRPRFVVYQFIFLLAGVQFAGWHLFLVPNALSQDIALFDAAFLASIGGIGNIIGRAFNGPLLDHNIFSDAMLFVLIHLVCALSLLLDPLATEYPLMAVLAFWAGLTIGASYAVTIVIAKNLAEEEKYIMAAVGWTHFFMGFGAVIGGPLVGATFDITGYYHVGFLLMGGFEILITVCTFIELMQRRYTQDLRARYLLM